MSDEQGGTQRGMQGGEPRQRVVRVAGARRAKLTPAPGSSAEPVPADDRRGAASDAPAAPASQPKGPNDDRLTRDVPPHY